MYQVAIYRFMYQDTGKPIHEANCAIYMPELFGYGSTADKALDNLMALMNARQEEEERSRNVNNVNK